MKSLKLRKQLSLSSLGFSDSADGYEVAWDAAGAAVGAVIETFPNGFLVEAVVEKALVELPGIVGMANFGLLDPEAEAPPSEDGGTPRSTFAKILPAPLSAPAGAGAAGEGAGLVWIHPTA